jgi:putative PIN family toxin of toxin-antitoxin system
VPAKDAVLIRLRLEANALIVEPDFSLAAIPEDPDDNRVLECAVAGKADYIVSGDRHLLKLHSYLDISIVTVWQFMDAVEAEN